MNLYEQIKNKTAKISVIGLGYVGLPLAVAFSSAADVIGFDLNREKVGKLLNGIDPTGEVGSEKLKASSVNFTLDESKLRQAMFHIIAVPTPIKTDKTPDLSPIISASEIVGRNLIKGSVVVYESTVYPGVTENICVPVLEKYSGLTCGTDFKIGYSPERINPGDKIHRLENIKKIVSGLDEETTDIISDVYNLIIKSGTHKVSTIKTAEAIKVAENSQRDINIAFMNELAMVFDIMDIDTSEVLDGMNTKWNALKFSPGLVGGHCIGVDPYYFIYEAENLGFHSQIVLSGRKVNDCMGKFVAEKAVEMLKKSAKDLTGASAVIFGITFKENCPDVRNSKVFDIINILRENKINIQIIDPWANDPEALEENNIKLTPIGEIKPADCLIFAVAHDEFKNLTVGELEKILSEKKIILDVKSIFDKQMLMRSGFNYWRL